MFINFREVIYTNKLGGTITREHLFDLLNNDMIVDDVSNGVLLCFVLILYVCYNSYIDFHNGMKSCYL